MINHQTSFLFDFELMKTSLHLILKTCYYHLCCANVRSLYCTFLIQSEPVKNLKIGEYETNTWTNIWL